MIPEIAPRLGLGSAGQLLAQAAQPIVYLGNSVTGQRSSYRVPLHAHLVRRFGHAHRPINAGLGAAGAMGSLYTMPELVLRHAPSLCFVECSVGDIATNPPIASIGPVIEGIIRQLLAAGCAVCLLHLYRNETSFGEDNHVIAAYERVAAHYGVPSINLARSFENAVASGAFDLSAILFDGTHSTPAGAEFMAEMIASAVFDLCAMPPAPLPALGRPYHPNHFQSARLIPADARMVSDPQGCRPARFRLVYAYLEIDAENTIRFETGSGFVAGILLITGTHSGAIRLDAGEDSAVYQTKDQWCDRAILRPLVFRNSVPPGRVLGLSAAAGTAMRLLGFLYHETTPAGVRA